MSQQIDLLGDNEGVMKENNFEKNDVSKIAQIREDWAKRGYVSFEVVDGKPIMNFIPPASDSRDTL